MLQTELVYGDRGKADQTIVALSNLLRYSVDHHNIHVKFQEELAFTCDYLNILKFSYDGNLDYDIYIPEEMKELQVPKFSLQPIVENCILHGFAGRPKNGKITIVGELEKDHIEATVIDNGAGMSPEQLEKLRQSLQNTVIEEKKTSIGLSNIHHRIQLLYGSEYGIRISSVEGKFTKVKQLLPLDPNIRLRGNLPDITAEVITEHRGQEEAADGDTFNC